MGPRPDTTIRAVLRAGEAPPAAGWLPLLLDTRVAGLSLLERHLLAFRYAGIGEVVLEVPSSIVADLEAWVRRHVRAGLRVMVSAIDAAASAGAVDRPILEQRADTMVDPRLLTQLTRLCRTIGFDIACVDGSPGGNTPESKSPYRVGVPEPDEARPVSPEAADAMTPVGVSLRGIGAPAVPVNIGRYYWHRLESASNAADATRKVLLATMKSTDGIFARTNRRVSLRISRLLLDTPVTPNMVTVATLVWGVLAGWLLSRGQHATFICGALFAWFASMLDGVDGELARAKFLSSAFGHWLEMVCDYAFYIALFVGLGAGVARIKGDPIWLFVGLGAAAGTIISFAAVARLKRAYTRQGSMGDFYLAYQRTVRGSGSNPFMRATPYLISLMTRAGFPYLLMAIAIIDMPRGMLVTIFIATHGFWITALFVPRLRVSLQSEATAPRTESTVGSSRAVGVAEID